MIGIIDEMLNEIPSLIIADTAKKNGSLANGRLFSWIH